MILRWDTIWSIKFLVIWIFFSMTKGLSLLIVLLIWVLHHFTIKKSRLVKSGSSDTYRKWHKHIEWSHLKYKKKQFLESFGCLSLLDETLVTSKTADIPQSNVFFVSSNFLMRYLQPLQIITLWCLTYIKEYMKRLHNDSIFMINCMFMHPYMEKNIMYIKM